MKYIYIPILILLSIHTGLNAQQKTAYVQIIHTTADPFLPSLDLYVDSTLIQENFTFGDATPMIEIPADSTVYIRFYQAGIPVYELPYTGTTVHINPGSAWIVTLTGLTNDGEFAHNPDGWYTFFFLRNRVDVRRIAQQPDQVDALFYSFVTDAPGLDIIAKDGGQLLNDVQYGVDQEYISLSPRTHTITLRSTRDETRLYGTFYLDLAGREGESVFIAVTGFLDPSKNKNGEPLTVSAVYSDGSVVQLPAVTSLVSTPVVAENSIHVYPTPVSTAATLSYTLETTSDVYVELYTMAGERVFTHAFGLQHQGEYAAPLDVAALSSGIYRAVVRADGHQYSKHFMIVR